MVYNYFMEINMPIILASGSPRRLEIMKAHGIDPIVIPADIDESIPIDDPPIRIPAHLAAIKAKAVYEKYENEYDDGLLVAADTIVYLGDLDGEGRIMGKPSDPEEGFEMLSALRNRTHSVITGICLVSFGTAYSTAFSVVTEVTFGDISDEELREYLMTDEAYDKAGGYAIQGTFGKYVTSYEGSYENVIGLPWDIIADEIESIKEFI